jgi:hypothetical protein
MRTIPMLLLVAACTKNEEDLGAYCEDTPTELAMDEASPAGFTPDSLVAVFGGTWAETLTLAEGAGDVALTLTVGEPTGARWVDSEAVYPEDGYAIGVECVDRVEVDAPLSFVTADGAFDEAWSAVFSSEDGLAARFGRDFEAGAIGGSFDLAALIAEQGGVDGKLFIDGAFDAGGARGTVNAQVEGAEDCEGDECSVWAANVPVGTWGETGEE